MVIIISSPSGVGKTTIAKNLEKANFERIVTYTSRPKRSIEIEGVDYYFIGKEEFDELVKKDFFIEFSYVHDNYYGISKASLQPNTKHKILTIDVQGASKVKKLMPSVTTIFLLPPSFEEWMKRINKTQRNNFDVRLKNAIKELDAVWNFEYAIVNYSIDKTVKQIQTIVFCEQVKYKKNIENLINELKFNIKKYEEG
ncbi:MAG: guanylate kinase [Desulfurella sp.]|uniref:guanylate kinase n=1 Tax=Desulfurella sp. TaxID=1962857 RepID=UPI003CA5B045